MAVSVKKKPAPTKKPAKAKQKVVVKKAAKPAKKAALPSAKVISVKANRNAAMLKQLPRASMVSQLTGSAGAAQRLPTRLQNVVDKSEIADLIHTFCRGIDRIDENQLRSVCHPDATIDLGPGIFQGTANDYIHWILAVLQQVRSSHHQVGNILAQIDGDVALVETYFNTHFRLDKATGREDVFMGGRFLDRMERRPTGASGIWKIVHRKQVLDWVRTEAVSDIFYHQNPDALWSYRTKTDPSYQMVQFPGSQNGNKLPAFLGRRYESKSIRF